MNTLSLGNFWKGVIASAFTLGTLGAYSFAYADVAPVITTTVHNGSHTSVTSVPVGTALHANVSIASTSGPTVLGSVDFNLYANTTCSGTASVQSGVLLATGEAKSATTTIGANGLSYRVHYNGQSGTYLAGDSACVPVSVTSGNVGIVMDISTSSAKTGTSVFASTTLSNLTGNATGTVAYNVYTDNGCTANYQSAGTKTVSNGSVPNSDSIVFNQVGTYYFKGVYSGDQNNNTAASSCRTLSITASSTTPTPTPGKGVISGTSFNDLNKNKKKDSGDTGLSGWTVRLYTGNGFGKNKAFATTTTDSNGMYTFSNLPDGKYSIEQIISSGWKQTTGDYKNVVISGGNTIVDKDFANSTSTKKNNNDRDDKDRDEKVKKFEERFLKWFEKLNVKFGWGYHK